jgi:diguanylate cyclase (GGDEF)-like protein
MGERKHVSYFLRLTIVTMKVLLVDDHGLFRHGLEMLLSAELEFDVVLHAATAKEALDLQQKHDDIDLVLLDYNLGADHGLDVLQKLKKNDPALPVAMVSGRDEPQVILSALGSGASGFIQKNLAPAEIVNAVRMVIDGGIYVPSTVISGSTTPTSPPEENLSRQKQLQHLAEIARRVMREKNLDIREQADIESEMTSALNRLVQELQQDRTRLEVLAFQDDLTGLANRRLFLERLEQALRNSRRTQSRMALVYLDLDKFKQINDTLGHPAGDALLKETAKRLTSSVREVDTVARLGGDEFTIILVDVLSEEGLTSQLTRLRNTLREPVEIEGAGPCTPSASIGAAISDGEETAADLMKRADESLYEVKQSGRDNFNIAPGLGRS